MQYAKNNPKLPYNNKTILLAVNNRPTKEKKQHHIDLNFRIVWSYCCVFCSFFYLPGSIPSCCMSFISN